MKHAWIAVPLMAAVLFPGPAAATSRSHVHFRIDAYRHSGKCVDQHATADHGRCVGRGTRLGGSPVFEGDGMFGWKAGSWLSGATTCAQTDQTRRLGFTKQLVIHTPPDTLCGWTAPNFGSASYVVVSGAYTLKIHTGAGWQNVHPYTEDNPAKTGHPDGPLSIRLVHHTGNADCKCYEGYELEVHGYIRWED